MIRSCPARALHALVVILLPSIAPPLLSSCQECSLVRRTGTHTHTLESAARAEDVRRHSALIARRRRRHCRRRSRRSVLLELKLLLVLLGDDRDV